MKKTSKLNKLIPAIALLMMSAVMMVTTSYAWFSMNKEVSVTGMNIEAKSDTTYLLISKTGKANSETADAEHAAAIQGEKNITINLETAQATALYPVAHGTVGAEPDYTVTAQTAGAGSTTFNWYTMNGTDEADGTGVDKSAREVASGDLQDYVLKYTLYFTVADGANPAANLKVKSCTIDGDEAVRCLVVGNTNSVEFSATDIDGDTTILAAGPITDETVVSVDVYVFYDGNAAGITTNEFGAGNIKDTKVDLVFGCEVAEIE